MSDQEIYPRGNDIAEGYYEWIKKEVSDSPTKSYDLGKQFFTISSGTIGFIITIEKLNQDPDLDYLMFISMAALIVSIIFAVRLFIPKVWTIDGETDLVKIYKKEVQRIKGNIRLWLAVWCGGLISGLWAIAG